MTSTEIGETNPSSLSESLAEAAPTPPVLCNSAENSRAWEPGQLHSDRLLEARE
jgi:hypothetical protein